MPQKTERHDTADRKNGHVVKEKARAYAGTLQRAVRRVGVTPAAMKRAVYGAAAVAIFGMGVLVGNGTVMLGGYATQTGNLPSRLDYGSVNQLYNALKANYDGKLTQQQLLDGIKSGLAQATGDPYTEYFSPKAAQDFRQQLSGTFSGIGAELGKDDAGNLIVVSPISGSPAERAGLHARDIIASINNASTTGISVDTAVSKIRGPKGTQVTLKLVRGEETPTVTITRDDIKVPSVKSEILDGNIGYLRINQFGDDTADLASKAAKQFKDAGVQGIVLDMRGNPGGLLDAAVSVSSLWLPTGTKVLDEKRGGEVVQTYTANGNDVLHGIRTAVLIDGGSASAAEITAGALRDNDAATLVGEKSFGKGSVQQIQNFADGSELKVTIARWYRPNGQNIDKKGIQPDKKVSISNDDIKNGSDPQKDAALQLVRPE